MRTPFDHEHADAWSTSFVDVDSLNAQTTDALIGCIDDVRDSAQQGPERLRSHSVLVLGPAGAGKTHLFARLRRRCGARAAFVLMRPEIAVHPTPRHVLASCVDALQRRASGHRERQVDVVVGSALAKLAGQGAQWPNLLLGEYRAMSVAQRNVRLETALEELEDVYPEVEPTWLEKLLRLPFASTAERRATLTWLSGREPSASQLERLEVGEKLPDISVVPALRTLSIVASYSAPIAIVFDQLENLVDDEGDDRVRSHGQLLSELYDSVRGLVLVQMALDSEWQQRIRPVLAASQRSRLEARVQTLELPTPDQRAELVQAWVERFGGDEPSARSSLPWPFSAEQWEEWRTAPGVTPRMLMIACREAYVSGSAGAPHPQAAETDTEGARDELDGRLEQLWEEKLSDARGTLDATAQEGRGVDAEQVVSGLLVALRLVRGAHVQRARGKQPHDLRVRANDRDCDVFIVQQAHHRSVGAALRKACEAAGQRAVVAFRESAIALPPTWRKVGEQLRELGSTPGARWVELPREEMAQVLAVHDLLASARSQDLSGRDGRPIPEDDVRQWAARSLDVERWLAISVVMGKAAPGDPEAGEDLGDAAQADTRELPPVRAYEASNSATADCAGANSTVVREAGAQPMASGPTSSGTKAYDAQAHLGPAMTMLSHLRVASVDRLVQEARRADSAITRAQVLEELRGASNGVRWLGRSIVALSEALW